MDRELEYILRQNKEIRSVADDLVELKQWYIRYKETVEEAWKGEDNKHIIRETESLSYMLGQIAVDLEEIAHEVLKDINIP